MAGQATRVVVVPHTHWDREWHRPYQEFRLALVAALDQLLDAFTAGENLAPVTLDGQTILLDDYLELRPWREAELRDHVAAGRLLIGPWYVQPDEFLVSGEALVRNLLRGQRDAARFGPSMAVGYLADQFGHIAQMPQILRGFSIGSAVFWRGRDRDAGKNAFWWQGPDGSRVLGLHLSDSYGNAWPLPLDPPTLARRIREICAAQDGVATAPARLLMNGMDHRPFQIGLPAALEAAKPLLSPGYAVELGSLADYAAEVARAAPPEGLAVEQGEYRDSRSSPLLPGVLSTRLDLKKRNTSLQTLLEREVEHWAALASLLDPTYRYPLAEINLAWTYLLQNHPHDSICGCSIDSVAREMHTRFDWVGQIATQVANAALGRLAGLVDTRPPWAAAEASGAPTAREWRHGGESMDGAGTWRPATAAQPEQLALLAFNSSDIQRTDRARLELTLPGGGDEYEVVDERGWPLPYRWLGEQGEASTVMELPSAEIPDAESVVAQIPGDRVMEMGVHDVRVGVEGDAVVADLTLGEQSVLTRDEIAEAVRHTKRLIVSSGLPRAVLRIHRGTRLSLEYLARDVPPHGYRTAWLRRRAVPTLDGLGAPTDPGDPAPRLPLGQAEEGEHAGDGLPTIATELYTVTADPSDGALTVVDRHTGVTYRRCLSFEDGGDAGDTYTYAPPARDNVVRAPAGPPRITVEADPLGATMRLALELRVPVALAASRVRRSPLTVALPITVTVSLTHGLPRVDIDVQVENTAQDHRLRVVLGAPLVTDHVHAEGAFEITRRPLAPPPGGEGWAEQPAPTAPQQGFVAVHGQAIGDMAGSGEQELALLVANHGLPEYEARRAADGGTEILLTLLRCVGALSRDDLSTRRGHAGPGLATPDAQCPGSHRASFALLPHCGAWADAVPHARAFASPLVAIAVPCGPAAESGPADEGSLPPSGSLLRVGPAQVGVSALKGADDGRGVIVRLCNLSPIPATARLDAGLLTPRIGLVRAVTLAERADPERPLEQQGQNGDGLPTLVALDAWAIRSLRLLPLYHAGDSASAAP